MEDTKIEEILFNDEFDEDSNLCPSCGSDAALTGYNELLDLCRFECKECNVIYTLDDRFNETYIQGAPRDWREYLTQNLSFPFTGVIDETQDDIFSRETGPLQFGDSIVVDKICGDDDLYGVLLDIHKGRKKYCFPLCDIAAENKQSNNFKIIDLYRTWFANCR